MLHRKDFNITEADKNKNESTFNLQGQSSTSQHWFDIDIDWFGENFSTREPDFYRKIYQRHDKKQDTNTFKMFEFTIGN